MKTYTHPSGLKLTLDHSDAATPAMVYAGTRDAYASSYDCATCEGTVGDEYELSVRELAWLASFEDKVEEAYNAARRGHPDYQ